MGGGSGLAGSVVMEAGNVGWGSVGFFILWVVAVVVVVFSGLLFLETLFWVICFGKNEKKKFKIFKFQFLVMQKRAPNKTKKKKIRGLVWALWESQNRTHRESPK